MFSQSLTQTKKLRQQFTVAIRRQKKQQIFESFRKKLRGNLIEEQQNRMLHFLDTPERREEWLERKARDLSGQPNESWRFTINQLFSSLLCFKGKGSFKIWIDSSIIKSLCTVFFQEYIDLGLTSAVSNLLAHIIYYEEQQQQEKVSYVADEILKQDILRNLIILAENTARPHHQISQYIALIGNLAENEPGYVIKSGGFTVCVEWGLRMLKQKKINRGYLEQIYNYLHLLTAHFNKVSNNYNFANQIFSLINEFIQIDQSIPLLIKMLHIIEKVIETKKQAIYSTLLGCRGITKKLFQFLVHDNEKIRECCWNILAYATSGDSQELSQLFDENNFIQIVVQAYEKEPKDTMNFDRITTKMMFCINNLCCEGDKMRELVLYSPLINVIIDSTHPQRSTNLRKEAYYCLISAVPEANLKLINRIVFQLPVLQKFMTGLETLMDRTTIRDIIQALYKIIKVDRTVFRNEGEGVLQILDSKFNFYNILQQVQQKYYKQKVITHVIDLIFDLSSCK